jgi:uncharacterized FlgJ-related protein
MPEQTKGQWVTVAEYAKLIGAKSRQVVYGKILRDQVKWKREKIEADRYFVWLDVDENYEK